MKVLLVRQMLKSVYWKILGQFFASCKNCIHHVPVNKDRFKSQALLDEQALLACLVYVDLNPIRAGICNTLEDSEYTSIAQRLEEYSNGSKQISPIDEKQSISLQSAINSDNSVNFPIPLAHFIGGNQSDHGIPYAEKDYFELADWTGRAIRDDKPRKRSCHLLRPP